ncbi:MAG: hypothetical protein WC651_04120, partial [Candidatus Gracilibacteria bacterium]
MSEITDPPRSQTEGNDLQTSTEGGKALLNHETIDSIVTDYGMPDTRNKRLVAFLAENPNEQTLRTFIAEIKRCGDGGESDVLVDAILEAAEAGNLSNETINTVVDDLFELPFETLEGGSVELTNLFEHLAKDEMAWQIVDTKFQIFFERYFAENLQKIVYLLQNLPEEYSKAFLQKHPEAIEKLIEITKIDTQIFGIDGLHGILITILEVANEEQKIQLLENLIAFEVEIPGNVNERLFRSIKENANIPLPAIKALFLKLMARPAYQNIRSRGSLRDIIELLTDEDPEEILKKREETHEYKESKYAKAVSKRMSVPGEKIRIFKATKALNDLPDKQAWISIYPPESARELYEALKATLNEKQQRGLENTIEKSAGVKVPTEDHFLYCPDEIIEGMIAYANNLPMVKQNPRWREICDKYEIKDTKGGVSLGFTQRNKSDLLLGSKCGDCTAYGSTNYEKSLCWPINPLTQVLVLREGGSIIGRVVLTFAYVKEELALFIDGIEFHPQAKEGKPYYERAGKALTEALALVKKIAAKQQAPLYALIRSNSGKANEILAQEGIPVESEGESFEARFKLPEEVVEFTEKHDGKIWFQVFEAERRNGNTTKAEVDEELKRKRDAERQNLLNKRLPVLEETVLNPAQIENSEIANALREKRFMDGATLILADEKWSAEVSKFFGVTQKVSPNLLAKKMEILY